MATTPRSDLVEELEKALTDEVYDGGMGALSEAQFSQHVHRLAVTAAEVVISDRAPAEAARRDAVIVKLLALGATGEQIDTLADLIVVGANVEMLTALRDLVAIGLYPWQARLIASALRDGRGEAADV